MASWKRKTSTVNEFQESQNFKVYLNRLAFCFLSIGLLWLTTLNQAYKIINNTISSPRLEALLDTCSFAQTQTESQSQKYDRCSTLQLKKCYQSYQNSLHLERARNKNVILNNNAVSAAVKSHVDFCGNLTGGFIADLGWWQLRDQVVYKPTCISNDIIEADSIIAQASGIVISGREQNLFSDTLENTFDLARNWSVAATETLNHLVSYTDRLNKYNKDYLTNKTTFLQRHIVELLETIPAENLFSDGGPLLSRMQDLLQNLLACTGLGPPEAIGECNLPTRPAVEIFRDDVLNPAQYNEVVLRGVGERMKAAMLVYVSQVTNAFTAANNFFNAVAGASGMVSWVQNNLVQYSPVPVSLCSAGPSPSWCSYSIVSKLRLR